MHVCVVSCFITDVILHTIVYMGPASTLSFPLLKWWSKSQKNVFGLVDTFNCELCKWMMPSEFKRPHAPQRAFWNADLCIWGYCVVQYAVHCGSMLEPQSGRDSLNRSPKEAIGYGRTSVGLKWTLEVYFNRSLNLLKYRNNAAIWMENMTIKLKLKYDKCVEITQLSSCK